MALPIYHNELYNEQGELIESSTPRANGQFLNEIPVVIYGSDFNGPEYSKPPMYDLSEINLGHFVLDCDNRSNLHYHGQGMTVVKTDMDMDEFNEKNPLGLDTGAQGMNIVKQGDDVVKVQIDATGAIPAEMLRDQERMIQIGAQVVQNQAANQTLGAKIIETNGSTSTLARISHNTSEGIEKNLRWLADFIGDTGDIEYKINDKFITDEMTPEKINAHIALVQGGILPSDTLYETARQAGFTKDDNMTIQEKLDSEQTIEGEGQELAALRAQVESLQSRLDGGGE